ncbi:tannase and feruloyl esterase-domain-containing protein [Aspergillus undulatus]|uniref:tannase and feruloyl esterase-domain-containing protein n=1 Tax=Aspergillus undulatus TaxID=1810928 RepID=UPI003CCD497C
MRYRSPAALTVLVTSSLVKPRTIAQLCTVSNVQPSLSANGTLLGIEIRPGGSTTTSSTTYNYCNVTVAYTHAGKGDRVVLQYALPSPSDFENRFFVAGGQGFSLATDATEGFPYGAASGITDTGYDGFSSSYDEVNLYGNGTVNWDAAYMLHVQRWGEEYDGVVAGAPAFRFAQQQFDLSSLVGEPSLGFGFSKRVEGSSTSYQPAQNGTVTAEGVALAEAIYGGLHDSKGDRAYLSWQIAAELSDAVTEYSSETKTWAIDIPSTGGEYVARFIELVESDNLSNLDNGTYDTLVQWMNYGMIQYMDSLQTTVPDLTSFKSSGGRLLHYHGESDPGVPAASSVHYWQTVHAAMYGGDLADKKHLNEIAEWYQSSLIPGAAHCGVNDLQPGPFPSAATLVKTMIDWIEKDQQPSRLNASDSSGTYAGETQMLCQ